MRRRQGFTLIELLVVIAIISLLVSILLPSLNHARELTKRTICASNMHHINMGLHMYTTQDNKNHFPPAPEWSNARCSMELWSKDNMEKDLCTYWTSPPGGKIGYNDPWFGLGLLFDTKIMEEPEPFYCPSIKKEDSIFTYPQGWYSEGMDDRNPKWRYGSIQYRLFGQPVTQGTPGVSIEQVEELWQIEEVATEALICDVILNTFSARGVDPPHMSPVYGMNVGFGDGHGEFLDLGPGEQGRAEKVDSGQALASRDTFVYMYFKALGTGDFEDDDLNQYFPK